MSQDPGRSSVSIRTDWFMSVTCLSQSKIHIHFVSIIYFARSQTRSRNILSKPLKHSFRLLNYYEMFLLEIRQWLHHNYSSSHTTLIQPSRTNKITPFNAKRMMKLIMIEQHVSSAKFGIIICSTRNFLSS